MAKKSIAWNELFDVTLMASDAIDAERIRWVLNKGFYNSFSEYQKGGKWFFTVEVDTVKEAARLYLSVKSGLAISLIE